MDGTWQTLARSEIELTCGVAVGANLYLGAYQVPQVMRLGAGGSLERLGGFDAVPGKDQWYAGTALIEGRLVGPPLGVRSMAATCDAKALLVNVHVSGIPRSSDGGHTWSIETEGLHALYCSAVAFAGHDMLVAASAHHFAPQGAIYRRPIDGGEQLLPVAGLPRWFDGIVDSGNMAAWGSTLAVADKAGNLYHSQDSGRSWSHHADALPTPSGVLVC